MVTSGSADADNRLDAFSGQSRPTNMVPFHMLHIVSYCVRDSHPASHDAVAITLNAKASSLKTSIAIG